MCKLKQRVRKPEADPEQFRVNRINEGNVGVGRVGLATAEAMLTSAEFRQLVEEFIRAVPEPGSEEEAGTCTKDEEASLLRLRVRLDFFGKLAPRVREALAQKLRMMEGHALDKQLLQGLIIPRLSGVSVDRVFSACKQGIHSLRRPDPCGTRLNAR